MSGLHNNYQLTRSDQFESIPSSASICVIVRDFSGTEFSTLD
jgi:hypothetical protein